MPVGRDLVDAGGEERAARALNVGEISVIDIGRAQQGRVGGVVAGDAHAEGGNALVEDAAAGAEHGFAVDLVGDTDSRSKLRAAIVDQSERSSVLAGADQPV